MSPKLERGLKSCLHASETFSENQLALFNLEKPRGLAGSEVQLFLGFIARVISSEGLPSCPPEEPPPQTSCVP